MATTATSTTKTPPASWVTALSVPRLTLAVSAARNAVREEAR